MQGISCLAEDLLAFEEICFMEFDCWLVGWLGSLFDGSQIVDLPNQAPQCCTVALKYLSA